MKTLTQDSVSITLYRDNIGNEEKSMQNLKTLRSETSEEMQIPDEFESRRHLCEELGLTGQLNRMNEKLAEMQREHERKKTGFAASIGYKTITDAEMKVWAHFLPTEVPLQDHNFDDIPNAVLDELNQAQIFQVFDRFTIRTPEGKKNLLERLKIRREEAKKRDPILIGWERNRPYLIARWGESLQPFCIIKTRVFADKNAENIVIASILLAVALSGAFVISRVIKDPNNFHSWADLCVWVMAECMTLSFWLESIWPRWNKWFNTKDTFLTTLGGLNLVVGFISLIVSLFGIYSIVIMGQEEVTIIHRVLFSVVWLYAIASLITALKTNN